MRVAILTLLAAAAVGCGGKSGGGSDGGEETPQTGTQVAPPATAPSGNPPATEPAPPPSDGTGGATTTGGGPTTDGADGGNANDDNGSGAPTPPVNNNYVTGSQEKCAKDWDAFAAKYKAGLTKTYESQIVTEAGSRTEQTKVTVESVTEAAADGIAFEKVSRLTKPRETPPSTIKWKVAKEERVRNCMTGATGVPIDEKVEVLEEKTARITVRGGTFDTLYKKERTTGTEDGFAYEHRSEVWRLPGDLDVVVKAITSNKTTMNGAPCLRKETMELTVLKAP